MVDWTLERVESTDPGLFMEISLLSWVAAGVYGQLSQFAAGYVFRGDIGAFVWWLSGSFRETTVAFFTTPPWWYIAFIHLGGILVVFAFFAYYWLYPSEEVLTATEWRDASE